jgi:hypothetical protein
LQLLGKECCDIDIAIDNMLGSEFVDKVREYLLSTGEEAHGVGVIPRYKYLFIFFILGIIIFCSKLNILLVSFQNQIFKKDFLLTLMTLPVSCSVL